MEPPIISILLLGDAGVGKTTFLSRLTLGGDDTRRNHALPALHDLDQPFPFNIRLYNRPYRFEFSDTASPTSYTLLHPDVLVLCYSIADPASLVSLQRIWKEMVEKHFNYHETIPVMVLGLKRDVREKRDYDGKVRQTIDSRAREREDDKGALNARTFVYPQEALQIAQELRSDRYCECSALTGELCREVFEDLAKMAAMTTTDQGGKSEGSNCCIQ